MYISIKNLFLKLFFIIVFLQCSKNNSNVNTPSICGNYYCQTNEDCSNCPLDCGTCNPSVSTLTVSSILGPIYVNRNNGNADDSAYWINPNNQNNGLFFLADKNYGIYVYDFNGNYLQHIEFGNIGTIDVALNNIDSRMGLNCEDHSIDILAGNLRTANKLTLLKINRNYDGLNTMPLTLLADENSINNDISQNSYGFTLYKNLSTSEIYIFDKSASDLPIKQWKIICNSNEQISVSLVRTIDDVSMDIAEGFVADDELGFVYFSEEKKGIHKYNADPNHINKNRLSLFATENDGIASDREGISLYKCKDGTGYLLLSSQGNSQFKVYQRHGSNRFVKTFITQESQDTDGIESSSYSSVSYPNGFVIIHDSNRSAFFVYDWHDIAQDNLKICIDGNL